METPWSTKIIDFLPVSETDKVLLKMWIWGDRMMWIGATAAVFCILIALIKP